MTETNTINLYDHQKDLLSQFKSLQGQGLKGMCIFHDTGTGKTRTTLNLLSSITLTPYPVLIVAPNMNIAKEWELENANFNLTLSFITYATLWKVLDTPFSAIVFDESHKIKSIKSVRTKQAFILLKKNPNAIRLLLSATPITQNELDFIPQLTLASSCRFLDGMPFYKIRAKFFRNVAPPTVRWQKWELMKGMYNTFYNEVKKYSSFIAKQDVCKLPTRTLENREYLSSPITRMIYKQLLAKKPTADTLALLSEYDSITPTVILAVLHRLLVTDERRTDILSDILEKHRGEKIIVWTYLRNSYPVIEDVCRRMNLTYASVMGGLSADKKVEIVSSFRATPYPEILIASLGTLSEGINLQVASTSIFYDLSYNYADIYQAESRNYRANSPHESISQYFILSDLSLDQRLYKNYQNKLSFDPKTFLDSLVSDSLKNDK